MNTLIKNVIENKRIILWGTGNTAKEFYKKFSDKITIYACTSNEEEIVPIEYLNIIRPCEIEPESDFIIICSIYYNQIRYQLMCIDGYEPNKNFIKYDIFEEQKVCAHGNHYSLSETKECINLLGKANYFIKPSVLNPQSMRSFHLLQQYLDKHCKIITISLFIMDSYWPQDIASEREINKYYVVRNNAKLCAFVEKDQVIEKYVDEGYSTREIMKLICKDDFFDYNIVKNNHSNCLKRARISDKISDIKMADYIIHNYNIMKLYCDRGHFNENLLKEYVRRILQFLGDDKSESELLSTDIQCITQCVNELPIYPSTAKILELVFVKKDTLYRQKRYDGIRLVTFEEYMEAFITYCQKACGVLSCSYWIL